MLNGGNWNGKQVVPAAWVRESTALRVRASEIGSGTGPIGYAYLWWKPSEGRRGTEWADSYLAYGLWGQFVLCLPAINTVIVHRRAVPDELAIAYNLGNFSGSPAGGEFAAADFLSIADMIVAAHG